MCLALNHRPCLKSSPDARSTGTYSAECASPPFPSKHHFQESTLAKPQVRSKRRWSSSDFHPCMHNPTLVSGVDFTTPSIFVSNRTAHPKVCLLSPLLSLRSAILAPSAAHLHPCFASLVQPLLQLVLPKCSTANHSLTHLTCIQHLPSFFSQSHEPNSLPSTFPSLRPHCPPITLPSSDNSRRSLLPYPRHHPVRCAAPHPTPLFFRLLILFLLPVLKTPRPILSVTWLSPSP